MAVEEYDHTRKVLINDVALGTATLRASLLNSNYVFQGNQVSASEVTGITLSDVLATFTVVSSDKYRVYLDTLDFPNVTGTVTGVAIYVSGFVSSIDRPLLFYISLPEGEFVGTEYKLYWEVPLFEW